ncbi:pyridoxal phosphate-dependent transferase [Crepidotus variabilis]|uniref:Pyridoxal phosphate-dependent transferase n=1 Tax=Crepidotus variabilis TaxID=179855 RepID=A0A9P6E8A7_9AGAR|nr:pyridoxal phosphate-dependent transferase [Crepidotus variabilis]
MLSVGIFSILIRYFTRKFKDMTTDWKKVYSQPPPSFGHDMKQFYTMDPEYINLNNGSYGATPKPVLDAVREMGKEIEANPDLFHRLTYLPKLVDVRQRLADFLKVKLDEVVLVTNASTGLNTVIRNFQWETGDLIFTFTTTYPSILNTAQVMADTPPHPTHIVTPLIFPTTKDAIVTLIEQVFDANPAPPKKKRVAIIDTLISDPGVLLPWKEIVQLCKQRNIWSIVDAAHSIGQETGLDLTSAAPDFWVSNCHKWLSAKRAVAVLYVPKRNQNIVTSSIPTSLYYISPDKRNGAPNFVDQYVWTGTIDWTSNLTVTDALDYRNWLGGEEKINAYCHDLAIKGGEALAKLLGTKVLDPNGEFTLNMVNVELPFPVSFKRIDDLDTIVKRLLLEKYKGYSAYYIHNNAYWTRCSAQIWNTLEDFEKMGQIWLNVIGDITTQFKEQTGCNTA